MTTAPRAKVFLAQLTTMALMFGAIYGLGELAMRTLLPRPMFMDQNSDGFWYEVLRLRLATEKTVARDAVTDPHLGWKMRPGYTQPGVALNAAGFRGTREYAPERPAGVTRIFVLGDSFAFGLGVKDEETFSHLLETEIPNSEVINSGTNGWGLDQMYLFWRDHGRKYDPHLVLLSAALDDFNRVDLNVREYLKPRLVLENGELKTINTPIIPLEQLQPDQLPHLGTSRVLEVFQHMGRKARWSLFGEFQSAERFEARSTIAGAILDQLKLEGRPILLAIFPAPGWDFHDADRIRTRMVALGEARQIPTIDLAPALQRAQADSGRPLFSRENGHLNAEGHRVAADALLERLRPLLPATR